LGRGRVDLRASVRGDLTFVEVGCVEAHLLRNCVDERVDPNFDCFRKASLAEWTTHAVIHFTQHAIRQIRLHPARVLGERRLRRRGDNEQQALAAGGFRTNIPLARETLRVFGNLGSIRRVDYRHVQIDLALFLEPFEYALESRSRLRVDDAGEVVEVRRRCLGRLGQWVCVDEQEKATGHKCD